ncbi:MAG: hypothetical protein LBP64_04285 [Tannerella sp.]|nr:hypothetical protein [Tannerella sp.]
MYSEGRFAPPRKIRAKACVQQAITKIFRIGSMSDSFHIKYFILFLQRQKATASAVAIQVSFKLNRAKIQIILYNSIVSAVFL